MRVLLTGAMGFVGRRATELLQSEGHEVLGLDLPAHVPAGAQNLHGLDLRNATGLESLIREIQPDAALHLGGIAFVPLGWTDPDLVFSVNVIGTLHLLEAFRRQAPSARVLVVTSAEIYGKAANALHALSESEPLHPENPYAISKMSADLLALLYARRYGLHAMTARPINHIGPGQSRRFVVSSFAAQLAEIALQRREPVLRVGNMEAERDFTDVRDVCRAYSLLLEKGRAGEAYNIAAGSPVRIGEILHQLCQIAGLSPSIEVAPDLYRPTDRRPILDTSKLRQDTGWTPRIHLFDTLRDVYQDLYQQFQTPPHEPGTA